MGVYAVIAATAVGAGTLKQVKAAKQTAKATEKIADAETRVADLQDRQQRIQEARSRRAAIRNSMIERARATVSSGAATGGFGGSGFAGGVQSESSRLGGVLGYQTQLGALSDQISAEYSGINQQNKAINDARYDSQVGGIVANIGSSLYSFGQARR